MISRFVLPFALCLVACSSQPVPRDASGKVMFRPTLVPHVANTPFWCFDAVLGDGKEHEACSATEESCARGVLDVKKKGHDVTKACAAVDRVSCYTTGLGNASECTRSRETCEWHAKQTVDRSLGTADEISACQDLDSSYAPPASPRG